jgi:hypothetical protein
MVLSCVGKIPGMSHAELAENAKETNPVMTDTPMLPQLDKKAIPR